MKTLAAVLLVIVGLALLLLHLAVIVLSGWFAVSFALDGELWPALGCAALFVVALYQGGNSSK